MCTHRVRIAAALAVLFVIAGLPTAAFGVDCNSNGVEDTTDISGGTSLDCNSNGTPDECDDPEHPGRVHNLDLDKWYCDIQDAIDDASDTHEIVVTPGTYYENIDFAGKAIHLHSEAPTDSSTVEDTVIDGNGNGVVVLFENDEGNDSIIEGFTITGGCNTIGDDGGGIRCAGASPIIRYNVIRNNQVRTEGGGIHAAGNGTDPVIIERNIIRNNQTDESGDPIDTYVGGGIYAYGETIIRNNVIAENAAPWVYGGTRNTEGGGVYCGGDTVLTGNTIVNNRAKDAPAIYGSSTDVRNCIIWGNTNPYVFDDPDEYVGYYASQITTPGCSLRYCCTDDFPLSGPGVIHELPRFVDPDNGDYRLLPWSSCVNAGSNGFVESGDKDADANDRIMGGTVDMGAFEVAFSSTYQTLWVTSSPLSGLSVSVAPADTNGNSNGFTNFSRQYTESTEVELTAADSNGHAPFVRWIVDDVEVGTNATVSVLMDDHHVARAAYSNLRTVCTNGCDYSTIQAAINASTGGDEIVVSPGTYNENVNLYGKPVTLRSQDPSDPAIVQSTIIRAQMVGSDIPSAVTCNYGETFDTVIEGFTITGGIGTLEELEPIEETVLNGGGVFCRGSDPTIRGNIITLNGAASECLGSCGGGICCFADARPKILNNTITRNYAWFGAGVLAWDAGPLIEGNVIAGNWAAPAWAQGGGINVYNGTATVINNLIVGNKSSSTNNEPTTGGGGVMLYKWPSGVQGDLGLFINNTIGYNESSYSTSAGGVQCTDPTDLENSVVNCIVWGNSSPQVADDVDHEYSCIQGFTPDEGDTSIGDDPEFVGGDGGTWTAAGSYSSSTLKTTLTDGNASWTADSLIGNLVNPDTNGWLQFVIVDNDSTTMTVLGDASTIAAQNDPYRIYDYHLQADSNGVTSPCIDTGTNGAFPWDLDADLDGLLRFLDLPWANTGGVDTIDMGAYEADPLPPFISGSWYSRKDHGALGDLDKEFDPSFTGDPHTVQTDGTMTSPVDGIGVETRKDSVTELILNFSEPMDPSSIAATDITVNSNTNGSYNPTSISLVDGVNGPDSELHMYFDAGQLPNGHALATLPDRYVACINTNATDLSGNALDCTTGDCDVEFIAQFGNVWPSGPSKYKVNPKDRSEVIAHESTSLADPAVAVNFDVWNAGPSNGKINPKDRSEVIATESTTVQVSTAVPGCP